VFTGVGVNSQVADAADVVVAVGTDQTVGLELQRSVLEFPETVDQHAEDMHRDLLVALLRHSEQPANAAELTFDVPAPRNRRLLLGEAGLAKPVLEGSVAKLVKPDLAIDAVEERVVLFEVGAETGGTGSFEYALVVLAAALALLALDVLVELLLVGDELLLVGVH
jgi:hypothetical protein